MKKPFTLFSLLAVGLLSCQFAQARNWKLELPIAAALNNAPWRTELGLGQQFNLEFGAHSRAPMQLLASNVAVSEYARPYYSQNGHSYRRDEASTCNEALRNALSYAANNAKRQGANLLLVSHSSYFKERPLNPRTHFLCNAGLSSSTVDLVVSYAVSQPPVAMPVHPVPTQLAGIPAPIRVTPVSPVPLTGMPHTTTPIFAPAGAPTRATPLASGYAPLYDIEKIPYIQEPCKKAYAQWLTQANPKAFFISTRANCGYAWSTAPSDQSLPSDPTIRAQQACNQHTQGANNCSAYAIDGVVVWQP